MADTVSFPTVDSGAAPVGWDWSSVSPNEEFPTVDSAAAVVPFTSGTIGAQTIAFATFAHSSLPGRFRTSEG